MMCSNSLSARVVDGSGDDEEEEVACALWGSRTRSARGGATEERERERERERSSSCYRVSAASVGREGGIKRAGSFFSFSLWLASLAMERRMDGWTGRQWHKQVHKAVC